MPYFPDLNSYLHHSSLLIEAYPDVRITTKYSLPRKSQPTLSEPPAAEGAPEKRAPTATLILKTFHPDSGICLKYKTDKAAEVGRLMTGLGRLAAGERIDMPAVGAPGGVDGADRTEVDAPVEEVKPQAQTPAPTAGAGGKGKNKKKGKR